MRHKADGKRFKTWGFEQITTPEVAAAARPKAKKSYPITTAQSGSPDSETAKGSDKPATD